MIDLEELLVPISEESPTGDNLRYRAGDDTFESLEAARRELDAEDDPDGEGRESDWPGIIRRATTALESESKDLELAARLTEALMHREGFAGLREGLRLIRALLDRFWDRLHPGFDEDEVVLPVRARPLSWLSTALAAGTTGFLPGLSLVPFANVGDRTLRWKDRLDGERLDELSLQTDQSRYQEMLSTGLMTSDQFTAALRNAETDELRSSRDLIAECETETNELEKLCEERFGGDEAPVLIGMRDLLGEMREFLDARLGELEPGAVEGEAGVEGGQAGATPGVRGPVRSRAEALARLREASDYFRQAEPHSPLAALIERAIRWGSMSFEDLVKDYIKDPTTQGAIWELLGIEKPPDEYSG